MIVSSVGPWLIRSVWQAGSLQECRDIVEATWGPGKTGACFAVITERWQQILFGFYPRELYWRPTLTMVLMLVAVAPILFAAVPRQLLWFSPLFPAVAFWLLWGGTVWLPVMIVVGFVLGFLAFRYISEVNGLVGAIAAAIVPVLWWVFLCNPASDLFQSVLPIALTEMTSDKFGGFLLSTVIGVSGITFSLPLGILLALGRQSDLLIVKTFCVAFIEGFRGVPLITLLFTASLLLNYFLPPGTTFDVILRVIIMVTIFSAAYMAEVIRGGLAALPRGQYEAADALGLDYWKAQRLIIMPQALKVSIPGIVGNFISLLKDTSLVYIVGMKDLLEAVKTKNDALEWSSPTQSVTGYIFAAAVYWVMCFSISRYSRYWENRLNTGHKR